MVCDSLASKIHNLGGFSYELRFIRTDETPQRAPAISRVASEDCFSPFWETPRKYVEQGASVSENLIEKHNETRVPRSIARGSQASELPLRSR